MLSVGVLTGLHPASSSEGDGTKERLLAWIPQEDSKEQESSAKNDSFLFAESPLTILKSFLASRSDFEERFIVRARDLLATGLSALCRSSSKPPSQCSNSNSLAAQTS